ncbi:MAG: hypothetical protein A2784_00890 [Candidatus Chisholmbacteria bacterium RIFCSPHIGHO2_01_FULL_48_12]|uniref:Aminotransferase n=1 Tax=Candidatus Chisholmbacteria bacterium RIFCSPHIGHO2_01_FULL_48_12 TaxID=1797589 RepID=A0A1G1VRT9_9BACT|nr:MAG: hypothetical protein A2784_00890 [Candidatus Chisholmbacteria bacterium RIFCSPHIGHO2_01_FULL_48_12]
MNKTLSNIRISPTNVIKEKIINLESRGKKIIRLDTIETNFKTPQNVKDATIKAILDNQTKYTTYSGILELKETVCRMLYDKYKLSYNASSNCLISCGSKHALFNSIFTLTDAGDEVLIIAPYWETYIEQVKIAGGVPIIIETQESNNFEPTEEELLNAINPNTKTIIINSPSNPTGRVYSKKTLEIIARVSKNSDLCIISDETMANFTYGGHVHIPIATLSKDAFERTLTIGSVSKDYSMSGFRIGFVCGNADTVRTMSMLQAQVTANPVSFSQIAAIEAWSGDQKPLFEMRSEFYKRKSLLEKGLQNMSGIRNVLGQGAVFLFPNISSYFGKMIAGKPIHCSQDFCDVLLENGIAIVPGNYFGEMYIENVRFSYSCATTEEITKAVGMIKSLLQ